MNMNISGLFKEVSIWLDMDILKRYSVLLPERLQDYIRLSANIDLFIDQLLSDKEEYSDTEIHRIIEFFTVFIDKKSGMGTLHSLGVSEKAEYMAHYYKWDNEKILRFYIAGGLHDIGKIAVPNWLIGKAGQLSHDEKVIIMEHAIQTYYILSEVSGFDDICRWASNHHEKLNGKGYPRGLTGKELDFESRLLVCIDIYQALTEARTYKTGFSHESAINIMNDMARNGEIDENILKDIDKVLGSYDSQKLVA